MIHHENKLFPMLSFFIFFPFSKCPLLWVSLFLDTALYFGSCSIYVHTHNLITVLRVYILMHTPGYTVKFGMTQDIPT